MRAEHGIIRWHRPQPRAPHLLSGERETSTGRLDMGSLVERVGVPVVEHAGTAREVALTLLGVAAEVEQALMVQYIYAAVSVADFPATQST